MNFQDRIFEKIEAAQTERDHQASKNLLLQGLEICEEWLKDYDNINARLSKAHILAHLALEENASEARGALWLKSLAVIDSIKNTDHDPKVAEQCASIAIDFFQDTLNSIELSKKTSVLRKAKNDIEMSLRKDLPEKSKASLLTRKSAILRHLSIEGLTKDDKRRRLIESVDCAKFANKIDTTPVSLLHLGLSEWKIADYEKSDEKYSERLRNAETLFTDELLLDDELAQLTLAVFYRFTFNPLKCCKCYLAIISSQANTRRILRQSHIYGEAAVQLWYTRHYPEELVKMHLIKSRELLELAVASGYNTARTIIGLAYTTSILEGKSAGIVALSEIYLGGNDISWENAVRISIESENADLVLQSFALGADRSSTWSSLGTFAKRFLDDIDFAEALLRRAIKLSNRNVIALTNLARLIILHGETEKLTEAERFLQQAQSFSGNRFRWWREVRKQLEERKGKENTKKAAETKELSYKPSDASIINFKDLRKNFQQLERSNEFQQRGLELEKLIAGMAYLTFGFSTSGYRIIKGVERPQIDGHFRFDKLPFRVECKWEKTQPDANDITIFAAKLDVVGVAGLFISMAGFKDSAISRAERIQGDKMILLMDGDEVRGMFKGQINFDDILRIKVEQFYYRSACYYQVIKPIEIAE